MDSIRIYGGNIVSSTIGLDPRTAWPRKAAREKRDNKHECDETIVLRNIRALRNRFLTYVPTMHKEGERQVVSIPH